MYKDKCVLVVGLARSGLSAIKVLNKQGARVSVTDMATSEKLGDFVDEVIPYVEDLILGKAPTGEENFDVVIVSPGVPLDLPFLVAYQKRNIPIIGEIELAYQLSKSTFIGITGTNGKTTTTSLVGEMFKKALMDYCVVGNIGVAAVSKAVETGESTTLVTELSSFQLESIKSFKAHIAAIINITPDHLNRHKTMENYIAAKARVFENQNENDYLLLNKENQYTKQLSLLAKSQVIYFSQCERLEEGIFIEEGSIVAILHGVRIEVLPISEMFIFGKHNVENALVAVGISLLAGIPVDAVREALRQFKGVEHRIEYVEEIKSRVFYNDSKGTNPESTICAIDSMTRPTVLIAGGMDKGSDFDEMIQAFDGKIKTLILLGETKAKIKQVAEENNFNEIALVNDMTEAVDKAFEYSTEGDAILLSPACASWDMYPNFEVRGEHFKACVQSLAKRWT